MAITRGHRFTTVLVLAISYLVYDVEGHRDLATPATGNAVFDVSHFGAKGNGKPVYVNGDSMNGIAFIKAWQAACNCTKGPSKVVIPEGTFAVAQVIFAGPCKSHVTVELQGTVIADPDASQFPNYEFIVFQNVDGATFTGRGTIDVSNQAKNFSPSVNGNFDSSNAMPSIKLTKAKNMVVENIRSVNPAAYHVLTVESHCVTIRNVKFESTSVKPNTNSKGIYLSASSQVSVSNSFIKTGDDCVTIAPGCIDVSITKLTCEAGQGISIGSKPYNTALDVKGVTIKDCTFRGTAFGVRIIPRPEVKASLISDIKVDGLLMDQVQNPIVINQLQSPLIPQKLIQAKIAGVSFKNIRGSTTAKTPLNFSCCPQNPCEGIEVADIELNVHEQVDGDLSIIDRTLHGKGLGQLANCLNAKVIFGGKHKGLNCGLLQ